MIHEEQTKQNIFDSFSDVTVCESTENENRSKMVSLVKVDSGLAIVGTAIMSGDVYSVPYDLDVKELVSNRDFDEFLKHATYIKSVSNFPYKDPNDKSPFLHVERHYSPPYMAHRMFDDGENRVWKFLAFYHV
jgi:hypothetical protein